MNIILFLSLSYAIYLVVFADVRKDRYVKTLKKLSGEKENVFVKYEDMIAEKLKDVITLDKFKKIDMERTLNNLNINKTAEFFVSQNIAKGITNSAFILFVVLFVTRNLVLSMVAMGITFYIIYSGEGKKVKKQLEDKTFEIDKSLVQFTSNISANLRYTKDVVTILTNYREITSGFLKEEITLALNSAVTTDIELALTEMEKRVNSSRLSNVLNGLISVSRGEDQKAYFDTLTAENIAFQNELIKIEGQKRLHQLKPNNMILLILLFVTICVAMGIVAFTEITNLF